MPGRMKSVCEGCGGEILYEKDSTGEEIIEANPDEYANLCGACKTKQHNSKDESSRESQNTAGFEDERNRAMRTGGREG